MKILYASDFKDGLDRTLIRLDEENKKCHPGCQGAFLSEKEVRYSHFWGTFNGEIIDPLTAISCEECKKLRGV